MGVELDFADPSYTETFGGCTLQGSNLGIITTASSKYTVSREVDVIGGYLTFGGKGGYPNGYNYVENGEDACLLVNAIRITASPLKIVTSSERQATGSCPQKLEEFQKDW